jgi:hypothetical protein
MPTLAEVLTWIDRLVVFVYGSKDARRDLDAI